MKRGTNWDRKLKQAVKKAKDTSLRQSFGGQAGLRGDGKGKEQGAVLWPEPYNQNTPEAVLRFLTECCWTYNEADRTIEPIAMKPYIETAVRAWHRSRSTGETLIIEKSRRMLLSWVLRGCELWSLGMELEKGLITGLDYSKAAEHVWRIWWLHQQLCLKRPELGLAPSTPRNGNVAAQEVGQVLLANGSLVETLNQDGLSFQGSGFSWVTMEEFSRYRNCDFMLGQAVRVVEGKPGGTRTQDSGLRTQGGAEIANCQMPIANCGRGGGHVVIVTNASSNRAWQAIKQPMPNADCQLPIAEVEGISFHHCKGKRVYLGIHYSADPEKTRAWADVERQNVPKREWEREMEMREDIYDGEPVYADYIDSKHCPLNKEPFYVHATECHYIGGWDCGQTLTPAFVLLQVTPSPWYVMALLEVVSPGAEPMERFAPRVLGALQKILPLHWHTVEHWGDTTVTTMSGANGETAQQAARRFDINIRPGSNEWAGRFNAVTWLLSDNCTEELPRFFVDGARCPVLREGFRGAYRLDVYGDPGAVGPDRMVSEKPRKDGYSHVQDALQYAACRVRKLYQQGLLGERPLDRYLRSLPTSRQRQLLGRRRY